VPINPLPPLASLVYFDAAARHRDLSRAASELGVTSSVVSRHVTYLEEFLGHPLFERKKGPITTTLAGQLYAEQVHALLIDCAEFTAKQMKSNEPHSRTIAYAGGTFRQRCAQVRAGLSARQIDVLRWTAMGKTASEVSSIVGITTRTVNYHVANILSKLNANNKIQACVRAVSLGLI
jgi:DNA-binding CsgD family transcriptional regulator